MCVSLLRHQSKRLAFRVTVLSIHAMTMPPQSFRAIKEVLISAAVGFGFGFGAVASGVISKPAEKSPERPE